MNFNLTLEQARVTLRALNVLLMDAHEGIRQTAKQAAAEPEHYTWWLSLTDDEKLAHAAEVECVSEVPPLRKALIEFLDANTPAGRTLDGAAQAYPGQMWHGLFGGPKRA